MVGRLDDKNYAAIAKRYCEDVAAGDIPACKQVRQACQRHLDDLARGPACRWHFDEERANRACRFIERLRHVKGLWSTPTLKLEPWQCWVICSLFGYVDSQGLRRFRKAYLEVPRKNAKTTLLAGIALFMLCADGEPGAEVYSAAVTREQAKICWETAQKMVKADANMRAFFGIEALAHSITVEKTGSSYRPLSRDADSLEGLSPHCAVIDELHAHKTREVFDVLNVAMGSRRNALLAAITTAGDNKTGVCYEQHQYVEQILGGRHEDDRYFGVIYTVDPEDDWTKPATWIKTNPNFGASVLEDDMQTLCRQAQRSADSQNTFLTKRLNVWVSVGSAYFNMLAWENRCCDAKLKLESFNGGECLTGLDLASKVDLAARVLLFSRAGRYYVFGKYYVPEAAIERGEPNYDLYSGWSQRGLLTVTPGNVIDFEFIERDLLEIRDRFRVKEFCFDPYQGTELSTRMQKEGLKMVEVGATVRNFSEPMKTLEALILSGKIVHDGDPVLAWMMSNVKAQRDVKDNVFPRKARNENKIDGAVALLMALSRNIVLGETRRPLCLSQGVL